MRASNKAWFVAALLCVFVVGSSANAESSALTQPIVGLTFNQNLTVGTRGNDVSTLQQFLISSGFLKIPTPTGYFGPLTKIALGAWQTSAGVYPSSGFFGPLSRGKMNAVFQQALTYTTTTQAQGQGTVGTKSNGFPVRLRIPKLNIDAGFQYTGLNPDGTMEIPSNIYDIGWFTGSARPGERGSSVFSGHVAQIRGGVLTQPGVFSNLNELQAGDKLYVINDKGESTTFVVREIRNYDPAANATDVFKSSDGGAHLNLITCEGVWNAAQLSYSERLVVFTDALD